MVNVEVVTYDGMNNVLACAFSGTVGANPFGYMAVGKSTDTPDETSTGLGDECRSADGDYARVALSNTPVTDERKIQMEGVFDVDNITSSTTITEVGIVDRETLLEGVFFCICQISSMTKSSDNQLRILISATLESV